MTAISAGAAEAAQRWIETAATVTEQLLSAERLDDLAVQVEEATPTAWRIIDLSVPSLEDWRVDLSGRDRDVIGL